MNPHSNALLASLRFRGKNSDAAATSDSTLIPALSGIREVDLFSTSSAEKKNLDSSRLSLDKKEEEEEEEGK